MSSSSEFGLVTVLRNASRDLLGRRGLRDREVLINQLVESAVTLIPAAAAAGISRGDPTGVRSSNATTHAVYELDQLQGRLGEGPCVEAADQPPAHGVLLAPDLAGADAARWPRFTPVATRYGTRSMLSVSLVGPTTGSARR